MQARGARRYRSSRGYTSNSPVAAFIQAQSWRAAWE